MPVANSDENGYQTQSSHQIITTGILSVIQ